VVNTIGNLILRALLLFLPAMVANASPVLIVGKIVKNGHPIDLGYILKDGRRLFGEGKTWEGLISGIITSSLVGLSYAKYTTNNYWIMYGIVVGLGALLGDLLNSFVKRRLGKGRGDPFPPFDQITFIIGAFIMIKVSGIEALTGIYLNSTDLLIGVAIAGILHPVSNYIAYKLGLKSVPW